MPSLTRAHAVLALVVALGVGGRWARSARLAGGEGDSAPNADSASAVRARDLLATVSVRPGISFDGPVLLVDDTIRSRWTSPRWPATPPWRSCSSPATARRSARWSRCPHCVTWTCRWPVAG